MKKLIFVVILLLCFNYTYCQVNFGVKGGLNVSDYTGKDDYIDGHKNSFHLGLMTQYMFTGNFGLESGLYYSALGAKEDIPFWDETGKPIGGSTASIKYNPAYIQLPLLLLYKLGDDKISGLKVYPSAGVYLAYGVSGKVKYTYNLDPSSNSKVDYFDLRNRFDVGLNVNLNFEYRNFVLGAGYERGLSKIYKEINFTDQYGSSEENNRKKIYNQNIKVFLGYLF